MCVVDVEHKWTVRFCDLILWAIEHIKMGLKSGFGIIIELHNIL